MLSNKELIRLHTLKDYRCMQQANAIRRESGSAVLTYKQQKKWIQHRRRMYEEQLNQRVEELCIQ